MKKMIVAVAGILVCGGIVFANGLSIKSLNFLAPTVTDKASILSPKEGEIVYERSSSEAGFWGYTNSQWIPLGGSNTIIPTGAVFPFVGATAPAGYKIADGSPVSMDLYPDLYAIIGGTYGENTGTRTFNLPDLRGQFVRGLDTAGSVDPVPRTLGSLQADDFKAHNHTGGWGNNQGLNYYGSVSVGGINVADVNTRFNSFLPLTSTVGGQETRPKNMALNYIIKL